MSNNESCQRQTRLIHGLSVLGALLTMGVLVWLMVHYTQAPDLEVKRAEERAKALAELQAQNQEALGTYGWIDQPKGIVRLPVERAMELTARTWQNPQAGRSNLLGRVEKATAKPPEAPSPFE